MASKACSGEWLLVDNIIGKPGRGPLLAAMPPPVETPASRRVETRLAVLVLVAALLFSFWGVSVGWNRLNLPGVEFRQAQTALSALFIQQENNFSLAYPTPVLGKPWSIPMEFPLYQWTVVGVSNLTGMPLTQSGRLVSVLCFYLTLPAVFLLLAGWVPEKSRRCLVLSVVATSPFYIFYARAFLMETMALMASAWFLLCYLRGVRTGRWGWLLAANIFGAIAGMVKVTTFILYLAPAAGWTLWRWWCSRPTAIAPEWARWRGIVGRSAAATMVPFALTLAWLHFADATKALNPSSEFMVSSRMATYLWGTARTRFSAHVWHEHWQIMSRVVVWLPLLAASGALFFLFARRRWGQVMLCLACFLGVQVLFPELYAWHEYYYVANALFLLVAIGLALVGLLESRVPRWVAWVLVGGVLSGQVHHYFNYYYGMQSVRADVGSGLTQALNRLTRPNEVLVITGDDWNSMIPYYARRRALMIRADVEQDEAYLRKALAALKGEQVGVLVLPESAEKDAILLKLAVEYFGLDPRPVLKWRDRLIFLPKARWDQACDVIEQDFFEGVSMLSGGGLFDEHFAGKWYETKTLRRFQLVPLKYMTPLPVRFFATYGLGLNVDGDTVRFGAHPLTQLCFAVPAGARHLQTEIGLNPDAYEKAPAGETTDGVELRITLLRPGAPEQLVFSRYVNPRDNPGDRGVIPISVDFAMPAGAELMVTVNSGPNGSSTRDWAFLGKLSIK